MKIYHLPVMPNEVIENLNLENATVMVDSTTGEGGHTYKALSEYPNLKVIGLDRDSEIQKTAIERMSEFSDRFTPVNTWFNEFFEEAEPNSFDAILFDLGISVFHYQASEKGFSFKKDEKLDMRLNNDQEYSAYNIINEWDEKSLADLIFQYGEERYSRRIAKAIVEKRLEKKIETSEELADIIFKAVPPQYRYGHIHPATRTFQAIRIEVNGEIERIEPSLKAALKALKVGGRMAVITFHSLEDRPVKWFFKNLSDHQDDPVVKILTKKPIRPTEEECKENPPSRSAKLRVIEKRREL